MHSMLPLWQAPQAWLRLLVNDGQLLDQKSLQNLMCANWATCEAVRAAWSSGACAWTGWCVHFKIYCST
jgi:hypothetical protein